MRIGNSIEAIQVENKQQAMSTTNYSKANNTHAIRLDITDIGKDTGFIIDQGRSMQDVISEAGALDVQTRQDYMTVVSNTMSEEDYAQMCKDGFKPSQMSDEETVTIMDHIKAVVAQSGDVVAGFNDDLNTNKLEAITGSAAKANSLAKAMKEADIPQTEANAKKINNAANEIQGINEIKEAGIQYMLENGMEPSIDNIYLANYSVAGAEKTGSKAYFSLGMQGYLAQKADAADISNLKDNIEKTVAEFEIEDIDHNTQIREANWLVEKGIDLTKSNIEKLDEIFNVKLPISYEEASRRAAFSLSRGEEAKKANLAEEEPNIYLKAAKILEKTNDISDNQLKNVINSNRRITINNLYYAQTEAATLADDNSALQTGRAALEEIRLRMTLDVNVSLLKRGIEMDTMPLSNLVDTLKAGQELVNRSIYGNEQPENLGTKASVFNNTRQLVSELPYMPAAVIGRLKIEAEYSLTTVHQIGTDLKARYEAAGESYEQLMTAPRKDMGDSISKAFRNVDAILADIGLENNEINAKSVRILGYNSMEINAESIGQVSDRLNEMNQLIDSLTPARTLELIRQGINPLEMNITDLTKTLNQMETTDNDDKYSKFLYKLEKSNEISASEREAYIGIYRLINRLEKTDGAAIGALINENVDISFKSLLTGMRSRGVKFNESIDDNYGFIQDVIKKGVSISDQIEQAFVKQVGDDKNAEYDKAYTNEAYKDYINTLLNGQDAAKGLVSEAESVTADNIAAYNALNDSDNNVFNILKKYEKRSERAQKAFDDYKSKADSVLESFDNRDTAMAQYESMINAGKDTIEEYQYSADSYLDLNQMRLSHKQLSLALNRSKQERYTVPMDINGEVTAINLTLRHGDESSVVASFESAQYGQITAHFSIANQNVKGMIVSELKDGVGALKEVVSRMAEKTELSMDINVVVGKEIQTFAERSNDSSTSADNNSVDTSSLYKLAKSFLMEYSLSA